VHKKLSIQYYHLPLHLHLQYYLWTTCFWLPMISRDVIVVCFYLYFNFDSWVERSERYSLGFHFSISGRGMERLPVHQDRLLVWFRQEFQAGNHHQVFAWWWQYGQCVSTEREWSEKQDSRWVKCWTRLALVVVVVVAASAVAEWWWQNRERISFFCHTPGWWSLSMINFLVLNRSQPSHRKDLCLFSKSRENPLKIAS
jgi:hypothetical protein